MDRDLEGGYAMILFIMILLISLITMKCIRLYHEHPMTYEQLLRKGLVMELLFMENRAVDVYERGLRELDLTVDEENNVHYLVGMIQQKYHKQSKQAVAHFEEVFKKEPEYLAYRKEYQHILDAYESSNREELPHIAKMLRKQSQHDHRFLKLKYPE